MSHTVVPVCPPSLPGNRTEPARAEALPDFSAVLPAVGLWSIPDSVRIGILSKTVAAIPDLRGFFPREAQLAVFPEDPSFVDVVAGWGRKTSGIRAQQYSDANGTPLLLLEDGFVRSVGLGLSGARPLSLVLDDVGIYFDATSSSRLELLLEEGGWESPELLRRAAACMASMRRHRISKYNVGVQPSPEVAARLAEPFVLVVDQTHGDASVRLALAGEDSFAEMLAAAVRENPGRRVVVRTHPDVVAGHRTGYLAQLAEKAGAELLAANLEPWALVEAAERVYTVSSQLGFEALMAGKPVRCFGLPFYAGWGATEDAIRCVRRTRRRSAVEIFAAAYLLYARYVDPFTGEATTLERTIDTASRWRSLAGQGPAVCLGFSSWKRRNVRRLLAQDGTQVVFKRTAEEAVRTAGRIGGRIVVWASRQPEGLAERAAEAEIPVSRMEDGFIRSVGLGAALVPALSYVIDRRGMHYDPSARSDLEAILEAGDFDPLVLARASTLITAVTRANVTKYNVGRAEPAISWPTDGRRRILVPGQVEDDASVLRGSRLIRRNADLLAAVRTANPDAFIVFKPHPDVEQGFRLGAVPLETAMRHADAQASDAHPAALLAMVDEVHTITSLMGFEALLRGRQVVTYGRPFYAGWGLTKDLDPPPRRGRHVTLEELAAAALILYPHYLDPKTGLPCGPETALARLADPGMWQDNAVPSLLRRICGRLWSVRQRLHAAAKP
jgi:capsular polysaccharide export protein